MSKDHHFHASQNPKIVRKLNERIQEKVNAGWEMPSGWLFKGLTILFPQNDKVDDAEVDETSQTHQQYRLNLARNTVRFAGANVVDSKSSSVTHIVVAPGSSSSDVSSIRKSHSAKPGKKVPHLVTAEWIEECWKQRTLLGEEGMLKPNHGHGTLGLLHSDHFLQGSSHPEVPKQAPCIIIIHIKNQPSLLGISHGPNPSPNSYTGAADDAQDTFPIVHTSIHTYPHFCVMTHPLWMNRKRPHKTILLAQFLGYLQPCPNTEHGGSLLQNTA